MPTYTQTNRRLVLTTPLGTDALLLTSFRGEDRISRLFHFQLEMLSEQDAIDPASIVGQNVTVGIKLADGETQRYFNGFVSRFSAGGKTRGLRRYSAEIVPWLWFLTQTADCRIFQEKTVVEIVQQIFGDLGFTSFEIGEIKGSHPKREYCVQYRETDFNFVSRLLEQEGIFYFFRHEQGKHTLVLADQKQAHKWCAEKDVEQDYTASSIPNVDRINDWHHDFAFVPGKWAQTDYNFQKFPARTSKTPSSLLMTNETSVVKLKVKNDYEVYDYPGEYETTAEGKTYTKVRMEAEEATHDVVNGSSTCKTFNAGSKFNISKHDSQNEVGKAYVLTAVRHDANEPADYMTGSSASPFEYANSFRCIPESVTFRPERITPKPAIYGTQTAVVTGPPGEEIFPDKYGRVKVQFFWDREGVRDEKTSCFVRCAQTSAGKNWGAMFIPRIGQEVVVTYLEGDPDRPLITGVVYNDDQMPPYALPAEKTKSTIKTNSSPGGDGFNEIRFEDKKGAEQIFVHAQRNMDLRVRNDLMETVVGERHMITGYEKDGQNKGDQYELIHGNRYVKVRTDQHEQIEGNYYLTVGLGENGGDFEFYIDNQKSEYVKNDSYLEVGGSYCMYVESDISMDCANLHLNANGLIAMEAGEEIHIKSTQKIVIEGMQVSIKSGGNFIDIGPSGVSIKGSMVLINSGGAAAEGSGCEPTVFESISPTAPPPPTPADNAKTGKKSAPDSLS
ncbi:MAG: type VI secretion system tip protein TssI/VgrG [Planctomycetota bacterium]